MDLKITPYRLTTKSIVIISTIVSVIALIIISTVASVIDLKIDADSSFFMIAAVSFIWILGGRLIPLNNKLRKKSITITDDEIIGENALSNPISGEWIESISINRRDVVEIAETIQSPDLFFDRGYTDASNYNLVIKTSDKSYIVPGRIIDCVVVEQALKGNLSEAREMMEKKSRKKNITNIIFLMLGDIAIIVVMIFLQNQLFN